jgi:hypothetical protein
MRRGVEIVSSALYRCMENQTASDVLSGSADICTAVLGEVLQVVCMLGCLVFP